MSITDTSETRELQELVQRSEELRKVFAQTSAQVDALGEDPGENLRQIADAGIYRMHIPQVYGGLSNGTFPFGFGAVAESITQLSAGEGSTGMIYTVQTVVLREIFTPHVELPESTLRQLAHEVLEENARFVASNAETGTSGRVILSLARSAGTGYWHGRL